MYDIDCKWVEKVTCFIGIICCFNVASCKTKAEKNIEMELWQHNADSIGNATLDSIYKQQVKECDSLQKLKIPLLVDSLIKNDSITRILDKKK